MPTLEIIVSTAGSVRMETKGITGSQCRDITKPLEQALGVCTADQTTPEQYLASLPSTLHTQQQRGS